MTTPTILALEDSQDRIALFELWLGKQADVVWCRTPAEFQAELHARQDVRLIMLDYDLGPVFGEADGRRQRLTGRHGARHIPDNCDVPVVIWSAHDRAVEIEQDLTERGIACRRVPFIHENFNTLKAIAREAVR